MSGFGDDEEEYQGPVTVVLPGEAGDGGEAGTGGAAADGEAGKGEAGTDGGAGNGGTAADGRAPTPTAPVPVEVQAHLAGHFSPLTGDYRWRGRLSASEAITAAFRDGVRTVVVRTPDGFEGDGVLDDPNLWGGHPVRGTGTPPFAVPRIEIDD
ncbi:DUF4873 domain-containing protein [Nocardiopsis sp. NRRL B-16309]|uniref:DUF4873 domain-containing protein n=1 Tax=Nocardiopsis sp. NRRL B-16309 TaxID=1519494 RepID=UPI0006ADEBA2|nr:DUF4873 domain-containing protein [Nocardiopsis sp. NRRL B-16309]KOX24261.1 monooxygenase [Nocardiopsis sp. NRRL B-16309]